MTALPDTVRGLLAEVYTAFQANARRLATMGVRAVLEAVMIDKVRDNGSFAKNLDAFQVWLRDRPQPKVNRVANHKAFRL